MKASASWMPHLLSLKRIFKKNDGHWKVGILVSHQNDFKEKEEGVCSALICLMHPHVDLDSLVSG